MIEGKEVSVNADPRTEKFAKHVPTLNIIHDYPMAYRRFRRNAFTAGWARSDKSTLQGTLSSCPSDRYIRKTKCLYTSTARILYPFL